MSALCKCTSARDGKKRRTMDQSKTRFKGSSQVSQSWGIMTQSSKGSIKLRSIHRSVRWNSRPRILKCPLHNWLLKPPFKKTFSDWQLTIMRHIRPTQRTFSKCQASAISLNEAITRCSKKRRWIRIKSWNSHLTWGLHLTLRSSKSTANSLRC